MRVVERGEVRKLRHRVGLVVKMVETFFWLFMLLLRSQKPCPTLLATQLHTMSVPGTGS